LRRFQFKTPLICGIWDGYGGDAVFSAIGHGGLSGAFWRIGPGRRRADLLDFSLDKAALIPAMIGAYRGYFLRSGFAWRFRAFF